MSDLSKIYALADELTAKPKPRYRDDWERGHDAGRLDAGRVLKALLEDIGDKP